MADDLLGALTATIAILTFPIGVLSLFFASFEVAIVVFVVGWFLLVPMIPIVGREVLPAIANRLRGEPESQAPDPLEELRERYARGEIDDEEFERRVERLVATEGSGLDPAVAHADDRETTERECGRESAR